MFGNKNHGAWIKNVYTNAAGTTLAIVTTQHYPNLQQAGATLAESRLTVDAFGRLFKEERKLPSGSFTARQTLYDVMGHVTSVSEWGNTARATTYSLFDGFGRPIKINLADGKQINMSYTGDRIVARQVFVGTSRDAGTGAITETGYWSRWRRDRQGRLREAVERSENGTANEITTIYGYDVGNRLVSTSTTAGGVTQTRSFGYDNRGFMTFETHPEKGGSSGYGTVTYSLYDALGHAGRVVDGPNDLSMCWDRAERLFEVRATPVAGPACGSGSTGQLLKRLTYATSNQTNNHRNGKVDTAERFNYPVVNGTTFTVQVTEGYTYGGKAGGVSARDTSSWDGTNTFAYTQGWTYTDLGDVATTSYPQCQHQSCADPMGANGSAPLTVSYTYSNGWLTAIPGYLTGISYHTNQQVNQINHANGAVATYGLDPNSMLRVASVGTNKGWSTGQYSYDGAGNIVRINTFPNDSWYLYDGVSRLVQSSTKDGMAGAGTSQAQSYSFDPFGNIQSIVTNGVTRATPTSSTTNRLQSPSAYDTAGNLVSWNGTPYLFDKLNQMSRYGPAGEQQATHVYTADDERLWHYLINPLPGVSHWTVRDLDGKVLRDYVSTDWTPKDYIYAGSRVVASRTGKTTSTVQHLHTDHLGTVRQITNSSGASVEYHVYYPFGEEITAPGAEELKYTGHERDLSDPTSGGDDLDYMHARHASPMTGRFTSTDWIGGSSRMPQSRNRYAYVLGNPLKLVDPTGLVFECDGVCTDEVTAIGDAPSFSFPDSGRRGLFGGLLPGFGQSQNQMIIAALARGEGGDFSSPNSLVIHGVAELAPLADLIDDAIEIGSEVGMAMVPLPLPGKLGVLKLLGRNATKLKAGKLMTDLPGGKAAAKSVFRGLTKGQKIFTERIGSGGVLNYTADRAIQIRIYADRAVVEISHHGVLEKIHFYN